MLSANPLSFGRGKVGRVFKPAPITFTFRNQQPPADGDLLVVYGC